MLASAAYTEVLMYLMRYFYYSKGLTAMLRVRNRVAAVRADKGLSQRGLSRVSNVTPVIVRRIEAEVGYEPRLSVVRRLCQALGDMELFWLEEVTATPAPPAR